MKQGPDNPSRRKFLQATGALSAVAAVGGAAVVLEKMAQKREAESRIEDPLDFLSVKARPRLVRLGPLADRKVFRDVDGKRMQTPIRLTGDLELLTGIKEAEREVWIDPHRQLAALWRAKFALLPMENGNYRAQDIAAGKKLFLSYDPNEPHLMTLEKYRESIGTTLTDTRSALDLVSLTRLAQFNKLDEGQLALVKEMERHITADSMLSYVLTEIMPTSGRDAPLGLEVLDEILKHYGRDYLGLIPSLHDDKISYADYQATDGMVQEKFVRNAKGERQEKFHGASVVHKLFLPSRRIPADFTDLRGDQHHVAAYLFAIYNIALGVRQLGAEKTKQFSEAGTFISSTFTDEYIAAAHHRMADAIEAFKSYADAIIAYARMDPAKRERMVEPDFARAAKAADDKNREYNKKAGKKIKPVDLQSYVLKARSNRLAVWNRFGSRAVSR